MVRDRSALIRKQITLKPRKPKEPKEPKAPKMAPKIAPKEPKIIGDNKDHFWYKCSDIMCTFMIISMLSVYAKVYVTILIYWNYGRFLRILRYTRTDKFPIMAYILRWISPIIAYNCAVHFLLFVDKAIPGPYLLKSS